MENQVKLASALALAADAHSDQYAWNGEPYFFHPLEVMRRCPDFAKVVGTVHDVPEDTYFTIDQVAQALDLTEEETKALRLVTHDDKTLPYLDYVMLIAQSGNRIAIAVKLADLSHNIERCAKDAKKNWKRLEKYQQAYDQIMEFVQMIKWNADGQIEQLFLKD